MMLMGDINDASGSDSYTDVAGEVIVIMKL